MIDNRNLILAIVLSLVILLGFQYFFPQPDQPRTDAQPAAQGQTAQGQTGQAPTPAAPGAVGAPVPSVGAAATALPAKDVRERAAVIADGPRIAIDTKRLKGSIALKGGRIDDLILADYRETAKPDSAPIVLLSPEGTEHAYFAEFGWSIPDGGSPDANSLWQASGRRLTQDTPVTLTWNNGQGLVFKRTFAIDANFLFTVTQTVENAGGKALRVYPYTLATRRGTPDTANFYILHEGLLGVFDGTLSELKYNDLKEKGKIEKTATGGWIGITDKYWLVALVPGKDVKHTARFVHHRAGGTDKYQIDTLGEERLIAPGASVTATSHLFAGAKEVALLDKYAEEEGIDRFDLAVDFGWFYFLTKPIFYAMDMIYKFTGNFGVAILLLTVTIKLLFFPLANKSYVSMSKMRKLQPDVMALREKFNDDKMRLNQEMMALYKKEKVNPASGCLPVVVQIPVFFALYKVLFVSIEMRHAAFFGWITDLSAPDPTSVWNLFGAIPWDPAGTIPAMLNLGVWPLIMGLTMWLQQKLNPQPADPVQAKIFTFMPIMFTFLLASFPAGLVIYWAWNNTLSIAQQKVIMMRMGVK